MTDFAEPADRRRRRPNYPLPQQGMRAKDLLSRLTKNDLRHARSNGLLLNPGRGLYVPQSGNHESGIVGLLQALTAGGTRTVSHETAAAIHGLPDEPLQAPFHLTVPRHCTRVRRRGVVGHRADIPPQHVGWRNGIPLTSPAWTWADCAIGSSVLEALILADQFIRPGRPEYGEPAAMASRADLSEALKLRGPANGVRSAGRALELAREGADSPQETALRFYMHEAGLPEPEVNVWICTEQGVRVVQPDLLLRRWRLAIQYDGEQYHSGQQMRKDVRRAENTEAMGYTEVRITKDHMRNRATAAITKIERELIARGWSRW